MNIIFFGNTKFSAIGEAILHEKLGLQTVVTIPDRPDKKGTPVPSPTKAFAVAHNIPVIEADKLTPEILDQIEGLKPDFLVVEDYGLILPKRLLAMPKFAPINIHHSLLPKYRGPSPAPTAIVHGESVSGVSIIRMNERVDGGDLYAQEAYELKADETTSSLLTVLNTLGGNLAVEVLLQISAGTDKPKKQEESLVTLTKFIQKEDGYFDLQNPPLPVKLDRMIRAYYPWPGVWTKWQMSGQWKIIKLLPGKTIQMEGKKPMTYKEFFNGYPELRKALTFLVD